jgi:hypothetical protein
MIRSLISILLVVHSLVSLADEILMFDDEIIADVCYPEGWDKNLTLNDSPERESFVGSEKHKYRKFGVIWAEQILNGYPISYEDFYSSYDDYSNAPFLNGILSDPRSNLIPT